MADASIFMIRLTILNQRPTMAAPLSDFSEEWRDNDGRICALGSIQLGKVWVYVENLGYYAYQPDDECVEAFPLEGANPLYIWDSYYRIVLPLLLQATSYELLHASAVDSAGGVVAFCAVSETGKSTLAFALAERGYTQWADDAVLFEVTAAEVLARALPYSVRLRPSSAAFFGEPDRDSRLIPTTNLPLELSPRPFRALFVLERLPETSDKTVSITKLESAQAFRQVLPHAYCFSLADQMRKKRMMEQYLALAAKLPIYSLRFKTGLNHLDEILDELEKTFSVD
jgi:hypothetical protein